MSREQRKRLSRKGCTPEQLRCWRALSWLVGGDHHIDHRVYECGRGIETTMSGEAATWDGSLLTQMVLIAHCDAVRVSVDGRGGPKRYKLMIHPREHGREEWSRLHPTLDDLIEAATKLKALTNKESA